MKTEHVMPDDGMPHVANEQCPCHPLGDTLRGDGKVVSVVWHHREWSPGGQACRNTGAGGTEQ